jgi:ribosome modulation factor
MRKLVELPRAEQIQRWEFSLACLKFMRNPIGSQINFDFDSVDPFTEDDEAALVRIAGDAEAEGYRAGLAGVVFEDGNPHEVPSDAGQGWIKGYREGQDRQAEALGNDADTRH